MSEPGAGVIGVRAAITHVMSKKPKRRWTAYTPVGLAATGIKKAAGQDYLLTEAVLEAEMLDSQTDQRLGALIDTRVSDKKGKTSGKWGDVEKSIEFYANCFRERMKKAKGRQ